MDEIYEKLASCLTNGAPEEDMTDFLNESIESEVVLKSTVMQYVLLMEHYFDLCDIYAFDGWVDGYLVGSPQVDKFWYTADIALPPGTQIKGAYRLLGKDSENQVKIRKTGDGWYVARVSILRRMLDGIELRIRRETEIEVLGATMNEITGNQNDDTAPDIPGGFDQ